MDVGGPPEAEGPAPLASDETTHHGFARLIRTSAVFALGSVTGKVVGLVLLPFLTRWLTPGGFGQLDVLSTLATTVTSIAVLGLDLAATRLYAELPLEGQRRLFGSWMVIAAVVLVPVVIVLGLGAALISTALFGTTALAVGVVMVALYAAGNLYQVIGLTALRNQGRAVTYALVSTGAFVANGVVVLAFVHARPTANAAMTGMAIGVVVGGVGAIVMSRALVLHRPSAQMSRSLLRLGLPLVPALAATWIGEFANRAILLQASGSSEVGFLSVAVRFGSAGVLVITGFQLAWLPQAFAQGNTPSGRRLIAADARRIIVAVCVALVPLAVLAPELLRLVAGPAYHDALGAIGFSLVTTIALSLFVVAGMPSSLSRTMGDLGVAGTIGALTGVAANIAFARLWGATGTSAALAAGQLVGVAVLVGVSRNRAAVPLRWGLMTLNAGAGAIAILVCTLPHGVPLLARIVVGGLYALVLVADGSARELATFLNERRRARRGAQPGAGGSSDTNSPTPSR